MYERKPNTVICTDVPLLYGKLITPVGGGRFKVIEITLPDINKIIEEEMTYKEFNKWKGIK